MWWVGHALCYKRLGHTIYWSGSHSGQKPGFLCHVTLSAAESWAYGQNEETIIEYKQDRFPSSTQQLNETPASKAISIEPQRSTRDPLFAAFFRRCLLLTSCR